jgi:hypothetical protein
VSYFTHLGDRLVSRLITYGIFLHLTICASTIGCILLFLVSIAEHLEACNLATQIADGMLATTLVDPSWDEAYQALKGRSSTAQLWAIAGFGALTLFAGWLSVWGYFFVKRGGPRRRRR